MKTDILHAPPSPLAQSPGAGSSAEPGPDLDSDAVSDSDAADIDDVSVIDDVILNLHERHTLLSRYIDHHWHDLSPRQLAQVLSLHGENASRLARLLRDRSAIHGEPDDPLEVDFAVALALLSQKWGIDLLGSYPVPSLDAPGDQIPIDLDRLVADLDQKQARLSLHITTHQHEWNAAALFNLVTAYGRNAARLGRLLRTRHILCGGSYDELDALLASILTLP